MSRREGRTACSTRPESSNDETAGASSSILIAKAKISRPVRSGVKKKKKTFASEHFALNEEGKDTRWGAAISLKINTNVSYERSWRSVALPWASGSISPRRINPSLLLPHRQLVICDPAQCLSFYIWVSESIHTVFLSNIKMLCKFYFIFFSEMVIFYRKSDHNYGGGGGPNSSWKPSTPIGFAK